MTSLLLCFGTAEVPDLPSPTHVLFYLSLLSVSIPTSIAVSVYLLMPLIHGVTV